MPMGIEADIGGRVRLHRRLATEYAAAWLGQIAMAHAAGSADTRRFHQAAALRCRVNLVDASQAHSALATVLARLRPRRGLTTVAP